MNKIYSKVWNRELGQLVVASELASLVSASCSPSWAKLEAATGIVRAANIAAAKWLRLKFFGLRTCML